MTEEYDALVHNVTWELVPSHPSQNVVGNKWVYRIKYKPTGEIERYKARLVAKGFHQRPGIDYSKTFSLVIKPTTVRLMLSLAVTNGWNIRQLDINSAFLQGHLNEDVFMAQPLEFLDKDNPTHVCKLHKAIYGLKQAPRAWYQELRTYLLSYGFNNSIADSSLFIYKNNNVTFYLLVYVDDIIIMGPSSSVLQVFVTSLAFRFSLKDLGSLSYFLGIEVLPHEHGLFLSQKKYIQDLLDHAKMSNAKPVPTPMATYPPLNLTDGSLLSNPTDYRALIGSLQYLSLTRPDVTFAVNKLSQYMHKRIDLHYVALKRVLHYLNSTSNHGVIIHRNSPPQLHAFCDADWAGDHDNYVSTTGYIVYLGRNPIS